MAEGADEAGVFVMTGVEGGVIGVVIGFEAAVGAGIGFGRDEIAGGGVGIVVGSGSGTGGVGAGAGVGVIPAGELAKFMSGLGEPACLPARAFWTSVTT